MKREISFFNTHISDNATGSVLSALQSGRLSEGERVKEFEAKLTTVLGLVNPVAVNSGTAALHLALIVAGVGPDTEVILPAQTFVASGLVILMCGAKPVFADVQTTTGNIDPNSIKQRIGERTKAIMPVHWGGYPCDMDEINELARQHGLAVIEDAAHALGAEYHGRPIGSISRLTAFSFQAIKHLTTGDGGALCCATEADFSEAKTKRWFGIDRDKSEPSILGEREYDICEVGFKYHLNDYAAALGLANLMDLRERLEKRRGNASYFRERFAKVEGLELLSYERDRESSYWLFTILVERRSDFIRKLRSSGIPASVVHLRIDKNSVFGGLREDLPNQTEFNERQVSIPIHEELTDDALSLITRTIESGW